MRSMGGHRSLICTVACTGAILIGLVSAGYSKTDQVAAATGLKGGDLRDFEFQMNSLRTYDREIYGKHDVSAEVARRMTTKDLIMQTSRLDLWLLPVLYDNPNIGIYRASRCSNSMAELLDRQDFYPAFLQDYSSFNPSPKTNPHFKDEGGLFGTSWMLSLLDYPPLQSQSAGHEKQILLTLCKKYREIQKVNASYPKGLSPYGDSCFPLDTAERLARGAFPNALINSVNSPDKVEPAIKQLERLGSGSSS